MIITSFQPLFIPILRQLKDLSLISASSRFLKMLADADIPAAALPDMADASYSIAARVIARLVSDPPDVADLDPPVATLVENILPAYFYPRLPGAIAITLAMDAACKAEEPALVMVHNDVEPPTRLMALWAAARSVPCLHIPHAIYLETADRHAAPGDDIHDIITASDIAVAGPYQRDWYLARGMDSAHIYVTGLPQFDRLANVELDRDQSIFLFRMDRHRPVIAYFSSWRQDTNLSGCHDGIRQSYSAFLAYAKQHPEYQYIIKSHPHGRDIQLHTELAQRAGVRCAVTDKHLDAVLGVADVVIAYGASNVILESAAVGNAHIIVVGDSDAFRDDPEIIKGSDGASMQTAIQTCLASPIPNYSAFVTKYLGVLDGKSVERLVSLICHLHKHSREV